MSLDLAALVPNANTKPLPWQVAKAFGAQDGVRDSAELQRVKALPRRARPEEGTPEAEAYIEYMTQKYALPDTGQCGCAALGKHYCIKRLRLVQAWALYEISVYHGTFGHIVVGGGKTVIDLLFPLAFEGCKLALVLIPPNLVDQIILDYKHISQHFRVPSLVVHGRKTFSPIIQPGMPVLHVFPYSRLSRAEHTEFLDRLRPDVIGMDEIDLLSDPKSARTKRVARYIAANAGVRVCGWSGSISDGELEDYNHLVGWCLRGGSPMPLNGEIAREWGRAIDASDNPAPAGALLQLCEPGEHVRSGFKRRFLETPGVVSATKAPVDADMRIVDRHVELTPKIKSVMAEVRKEWRRPDGEEFPDQLTLARCLRELASGIYYRWEFPRKEPEVLIRLWTARRKAWNKELRRKLQSPAPHLDSALLCERAAQRFHFPIDPQEAYEQELEQWRRDRSRWFVDGAIPELEPDEPLPPNRRKQLPLWETDNYPAWADIKDAVQPISVAQRVDDYLARDAADWALKNRGIVWYAHTAFGIWVAELSGLPMHGGGPNAGEIIGRETGDRSIIASIKSHGRGRDGLQFIFHNQLVANPPASAKEWEQLLGRLHRIGQNALAVFASVYRHTIELRSHVDKALNRAENLDETLGAEQKIQMGGISRYDAA